MNYKILKNTLWLLVVQATNYIAPFIVLIHLTKTLGLEVYGILAFTQGISTICAVVLDFGFGLSAINRISKNRNNKIYVSKIIGSISLIKLFLYLICCVGVVFYSLTTVKYASYSLLFLFSLIPLAAQGFMIDWFYQGIEKMRYIAILNIISKVIFVISVVNFVRSPSDCILVPVLNGCSLIISLFFSVVVVYKLGYKIGSPNLKTMSFCFKFAKPFLVSRMAVAAYTNGAILALGVFAQPAIVSIYSMAEQLYKVMQSAIWPVAAASYPYMAKSRDVHLMFKLYFLVIILTAFGASVGYYISPLLIKVVFDSSWLSSIPVLNIFFITVVIHAAAVMAGYPLAASVGKLKVANSSVITGGVVYIVSLGFLIIFHDVSPAALAIIMLLSEISVLLHRAIFLYPSMFSKRNTFLA